MLIKPVQLIFHVLERIERGEFATIMTATHTVRKAVDEKEAHLLVPYFLDKGDTLILTLRDESTMWHGDITPLHQEN